MKEIRMKVMYLASCYVKSKIKLSPRARYFIKIIISEQRHTYDNYIYIKKNVKTSFGIIVMCSNICDVELDENKMLILYCFSSLIDLLSLLLYVI